MNRSRHSSIVFILVAISLLVLACDLSSATALFGASKPTVVIVSPFSSSQFQEGQDVSVQSTSSDANGIAKVELVVDGAVVHTDLPPQPQQQFSVSQTWKATVGSHTILVRATNTAQATSDPVSISVSVSPSVALAATFTPTVATPQASATISTTTPITTTATNTPTNTLQAPPPACPGPPTIGPFNASPNPITQGDSTTLAWGAVTNATSASIDQGIGPIAAPGSKSGVKPGGTTTYTLTAVGCGGTATSQVTVTVNPAAPKAPVTLASATANQSAPPAGGSGQATATCPSGTQVTGGGFATVSIAVNAFNNQSAGNGWTASAINNTSTNHAIIVSAVCATNLSGKVTRIFGAFTKVNGGGSIGETPIANCPAGNVLISGGFYSPSPLQMIYSGPAGGNAGWTASAANNGASQIDLAAIAVCYDGAASVTPAVKALSVAGSKGDDVTVVCPGGSLATGGGFKSDLGLIVIQSSPESSTGWHAEGVNATGSPKELQSIAMCTRF